MEVTQTTTSSTYVNSALTAETSEAVISSDFETFLKMLTVQMENQDPLNPTDSSEYALQLATFSGVEQAVLTNDLLESLLVQMGTSGMAQMASWVGKEARAPVATYFEGDPVTVAPNPAAVADKVELVVTDEDGTEVQRYEIPVSADTLEWDGIDDNGTAFPDGLYTFNVVSYTNDEVILDEVADVYSTVQEVRSENGETILILEGGVGILTSQVSALRDTSL